MNFSQKLSELMQQHGESSYKLSNDTGISSSLIGYYTKGLRNPSEKHLTKLAEHFHVSVDYLLGSEQEKAPTASKGNEREAKYAWIDEELSRLERDAPEKYEMVMRMLEATLNHKPPEEKP